MPYRSRPKWILLALIAAAAPALAGESSMRVYDLRDLLIDIPDYGPDAIVVPKTPPAQRLERVLKALQASVPTLADNATKTLDGQLIVTADDEVHRQVAQVLSLARTNGGKQIAIENRVLDVPDSIVGRLPEAVRLRVAAALSVPNVAVDLTADDVKGLLGATEPASGVATFAAPRLTVFNGQRAFIMVDHSTAKVAGPADHSGITLNTRASTDGHATSVAFTLTVKRRLPSNALTTNVFDSMFTLADGHSALYAATDAATPGHTLMLLIKPTAMMRQEIAEPKK